MTSSIVWSARVIVGVGGFAFLEITMHLTLERFRRKFCSVSQELILSRSRLMSTMSSFSKTALVYVQSSAKPVKEELDEVETRKIPSKANRKRRGPRMEPWGTPEVTGARLEADPWMATNCNLFMR